MKFAEVGASITHLMTLPVPQDNIILCAGHFNSLKVFREKYVEKDGGSHGV